MTEEDMKEDMVIRRMRLEDFEECKRLWEHYKLGAKYDTKKRIATMIQSNPTLCLVSEVDGRIAGTILASFDGRIVGIYHLAVEECYRGRGIGEKLIKGVEAEAKRLDAFKLFLYTRDPNLVPYFERFGFKKPKKTIFMYKMI
jgi:ribosomal protein S18 acetylase RimI-like enzyme